jgi:hypothetical protein
LVTLLERGQATIEVIVASPFIGKTKSGQLLGSFSEHYGHIVVQGQINPDVQAA